MRIGTLSDKDGVSNMELNADIAAVMQAIKANAAMAPVPSTSSDSDFTALLQHLREPQPTHLAASTAVARRLGVGRPGVAPPQNMPKGDLASWIAQAEKLTGLNSSFTGGINNMIQHESGGDPNSINRTDSNAVAGHPSQGLMQTIPDTFRANALPGYDKNILDPVSNIIAGIRYARNRYGDNMLKSGGRRDSNGNYIGY